MILKVRDELVEIFLEYAKDGNLDLKARKIVDVDAPLMLSSSYYIGYFAKDTGELHLMTSIKGTGLPVDEKTGRLQIEQ